MRRTPAEARSDSCFVATSLIEGFMIMKIGSEGGGGANVTL